MTDDNTTYKTINVDVRLYEDLKRMKGDHYTWTGLLRRMYAEVDGANYGGSEDDWE